MRTALPPLSPGLIREVLDQNRADLFRELVDQKLASAVEDFKLSDINSRFPQSHLVPGACARRGQGTLLARPLRLRSILLNCACESRWSGRDSTHSEEPGRYASSRGAKQAVRISRNSSRGAARYSTAVTPRTLVLLLFERVLGQISEVAVGNLGRVGIGGAVDDKPPLTVGG